MTLYEAWAKNQRWVMFRGILCKLSLPQAGGYILVMSQGVMRRKRRLRDRTVCQLYPMTAQCEPVPPRLQKERPVGPRGTPELAQVLKDRRRVKSFRTVQDVHAALGLPGRVTLTPAGAFALVLGGNPDEAERTLRQLGERPNA